MSLLLDISPAQFGMPPKFREYREAQAEAIDYALSSVKPFVAACAPTGIGKSLLGMTVARALGQRAVYLTATKALQEQILADFSECGAEDIRGKANYPCRVYTKKWGHGGNCDEGAELGCPHSFQKDPVCPYNAALVTAEGSELIVTNYSYWMHSRRNNAMALEPDEPGRKIGLLICDEAHSAHEEIANFLRVEISRDEWNSSVEYAPGDSGLMSDSSGDGWKRWAALRSQAAEQEMAEIAAYYKTTREARAHSSRYRALDGLRRKLSEILSLEENWVWEVGREGVVFDCIWPSKLTQYLWSGVEKTLLMSATLRPYTLHLLGLSKQQYDFREFSNGWPKNNGLIYYLPTVKLNYRSTEDDYAQMVERMDSIISERADRKGVIHTVSYSRMRTFLEKSRHKSQMIFNERAADSVDTAKRFRAAKPPAILVSPSFSTGWDFAYDQCEYQIIPKIPFAFSDSRVMKERNKEDSYRVYSAMLELTQMIGRGRRAPDDRCETFILDKSFSMLLATGKAYQPQDFTVHVRQDVPPRPRKLLIAS